MLDIKDEGLKGKVMVEENDGVGKKIKIDIDEDINDNVGIDIVEMWVKDMVVKGEEKILFIDY